MKSSEWEECNVWRLWRRRKVHLGLWWGEVLFNVVISCPLSFCVDKHEELTVYLLLCPPTVLFENFGGATDGCWYLSIIFECWKWRFNPTSLWTAYRNHFLQVSLTYPMLPVPFFFWGWGRGKQRLLKIVRIQEFFKKDTTKSKTVIYFYFYRLL